MKRNQLGSPGLMKPSLMVKVMAVSLAVVNGIQVYATDNGILDAVDNNTSTVLQRITTTFDTSIAPLLLLALLIGMGFSGSNERALAGIKIGLKFLAFAFLGINCINLIVNTFKWISGLLNGTGSDATGAMITYPTCIQNINMALYYIRF